MKYICTKKYKYIFVLIFIMNVFGNDSSIINLIIKNSRTNHTKLYLKNEGNTPIWSAIHYLNLDDKWVTEGWWKLKTNEEVLAGKTRNGIYYTYAESDDGKYKWSGDDCWRTVRNSDCNYGFNKHKFDPEFESNIHSFYESAKQLKYTNLYLKNESSTTIWTATRYFNLDNEWVTRGWINLKPNEKYFIGKTKSNHYYTYAETNDGKYKWSGNDNWQSVRNSDCSYGFIDNQFNRDLVNTTKVFFESAKQLKYTNLYLKNESKDTIWSAIHYLNLDDKWVTEGWWKLKPNERVMAGKTRSSSYYTYAETNDGKYRWSGDDNWQSIRNSDYNYGFMKNTFNSDLASKIKYFLESTKEDKYITMYLKNGTKDIIWTAINYLNLDNKWVTKGWWKLEPNEEVLAGKTRNGIFYTYAETNDGNWGGDDLYRTIGNSDHSYGFRKKNLNPNLTEYISRFTDGE